MVIQYIHHNIFMKKNKTQTKNKLASYIAIIVGVTSILYGMSIFFNNLDQQYFELHKTELTTSNTIISSNNSVTTNYFYANTPYHYISQIITYISLFFPILLVWILTVKLMLDKINGKTFLQSLCIPIVYGIINIIFFFATMEKSLGWEYSMGMGIMFIEIIFLFISVFVINGTILLKNNLR